MCTYHISSPYHLPGTTDSTLHKLFHPHKKPVRGYHNTHYTDEQLSVKYLVMLRVARQIITIVVCLFF